MKYFLRHATIVFMASALLSSCWPSDEHIEPYEGNLVQLSHSMYDYQSYFSLENNALVQYNALDNWDLGFECGSGGEHLVINTGKLWHAIDMGPVDINSILTIPTDASWIWDASSGNKDSLAIKNWVNTSVQPYEYNNHVFVLAKAEEYQPAYKLRIVELSNTHYKIEFGPIGSTAVSTYTINKNDNLNFVKYRLEPDFTEVNVEPNKDNWDIVFTQYKSYIPDNSGVMTPYILRGVLTKSRDMQVAITRDEFLEITKSKAEGYSFSSDLDAIGYDWKQFTGGTYFTDTEKVYVIIDAQDNWYKLRFLSYNLIDRGICTFEFSPL